MFALSLYDRSWTTVVSNVTVNCTPTIVYRSDYVLLAMIRWLCADVQIAGVGLIMPTYECNCECNIIWSFSSLSGFYGSVGAEHARFFSRGHERWWSQVVFLRLHVRLSDMDVSGLAESVILRWYICRIEKDVRGLAESLLILVTSVTCDVDLTGAFADSRSLLSSLYGTVFNCCVLHAEVHIIHGCM